MPALVVSNHVLVRIPWRLGGSPYAVNVFGARKTGALVVNQDLANSLQAAVDTAYVNSGLSAAQSNQVGPGPVAVRDISAPNNPEFTASTSPSLGSDSANLLPLQIASCVTLRTDMAGKSFRGRTYIPGFTVTTNTSAGIMNATANTVSAAWIAQLRTAFTGVGLTMAVVSRKNLSGRDVVGHSVRNSTWETIRGRAIAGI